MRPPYGSLLKGSLFLFPRAAFEQFVNFDFLRGKSLTNQEDLSMQKKKLKTVTVSGIWQLSFRKINLFLIKMQV